MSNLTISDLFTPAPSGVIPSQPAATPADDTWLAQVLATADRIGLSTTSWIPGDPSRTILSILAVTEAGRDGNISLFLQGGFLDFAANGTVTFEQPDGTVVTLFVTPDPSIPSQNPTGAPGWLDVLANELYNVQREQATFASGFLAIVNTSGSTYSFAAGSLHVVNEITNTNPQPTYNNLAPLSVPPSSHTTVTAVAFVSTTANLTVSSSSGFSAGQTIFVNGTGFAFDGTFQILTSVVTGQVSFVPPSTSGSFTAGGQVYASLVAEYQADVVGPASNAVVGAITGLVTQQLGLEVFNTTAFVGQNWESNPSVVNRCRLRLASLSPSGPRGAYEFFALTSAQVIDALDQIVPPGTTIRVEMLSAIVDALVLSDTTTGIVNVIIANAAGTTNGCTDNVVTAATTATPIVLTVSDPHNLVDGQFVFVAGIEGLQGANGWWQVTVGSHGPNAFALNGSVGVGAYTIGGTVEGGDLGLADFAIKANVPPDGQSEITRWADTVSVTVAGTVYVPAANVATYKTALGNALNAYFTTLPIGGVVNVESTNIIPIGAITGLFYSAGVLAAGAVSVVESVTGVTINSGSTDLHITSTSKAILIAGITSVTVIGT